MDNLAKTVEEMEQNTGFRMTRDTAERTQNDSGLYIRYFWFQFIAYCLSNPITVLTVFASLLVSIFRWAQRTGLADWRPVVSVLSLKGTILPGKGPISYDEYGKMIDKAFSMPHLHYVCLIIDSPGGSPVQAALIADRIRKKAEERKVPVVAFVEDQALSGGYWLALAGDKIFVNSASLVGSIGVIFSSFGASDAISKIGVERRVITSGKNKAILDIFSPAEKSHVDIISDSVNQIHDDFIEQVARRRGSRINKRAIQPHCAALVDAVLRNPRSKNLDLHKYQKPNKNDDRADIFSGAFFVGRRAVELGLADEVGDFESFIEQKSYRYRIVRIRKPSTFFNRLSMGMFGCSNNSTYQNDSSDWFSFSGGRPWFFAPPLFDHNIHGTIRT